LEHGRAVVNTTARPGVEGSNAPGVREFTQSEILILQDLATRREALDLRSREIDRKAVQLRVAEEEIDRKLQQLQMYERRLDALVNRYNEQQKEKINSLVRVYSTMKPRDAARIFDNLDIDIIVSLFKQMKPSVASGILSQMSAEKARTVTDELIGNSFFRMDEG
jgi:flagellar motility protein MotE (MotC chaperone)